MPAYAGTVGLRTEHVPVAGLAVVAQCRAGACSRRRDCQFADNPSPSILKNQLKGERGVAEWQPCRRREEPGPKILAGWTAGGGAGGAGGVQHVALW